MKTAKGKILFSAVALIIAAFLLWTQLKPAPAPTPMMLEAQQSRIAFVKKMDADGQWYHQADAHGVPSAKYGPMEVAATNATMQEIKRAADRPDWQSLTVAERSKILDEVDRKSDAARQAMRDSYYTKPFSPVW